MTVKQALALYLCTVIVMLPLDVLWIGLVARTFYQTQIGPLLLDSPSLVPAAAFYFLYAAGVVLFVLSPAVRDGSWTTALLYGAAFGLVAYATYDLSNLATLRGFSTTVALVDLAWGTTLTAVTGAVSFLVARYFNVV